MSTILRQSTQIIVRVGSFMDSTDGVTPETGITLGAADQAEALKPAGAATVDISGNTWAAVTGAGGWYDLTLTTTDTNTVGDLTIVVQDTSVCLPVFVRFMVVEEAVYDQLYAASAPGAATPTAVAAVQTDTDDIQTRLPAALVSGRIDASVGAMAANVLTATAINADAITAAKVAADVTTEFRSVVSGTSDSGTTTTMVDAARTEADDDYWKGAWILFTSGNISGQCRQITAFTASSDTITFAPATTQAVATQNYEILPAGAVDVRLWNGSLPNVLVSGRVDSSVGAMATGSIVAATFGAGAIDAAAIATDAIGALELSVAGTAEIANAVWDVARSLHVVAGSFGEGVASVQGNVTGSVGSIATGGIAAASFAAGAIDAAAIAADAIGSSELAASAVNEIADQVWDEVLSGHLTAGTTGAALNGASAPTAAVVADAVWDELRSGHVGAGSFGEYVLADTILISGDSVAADRLETMLDGTGGNVLTLAQLRINSASAAGAIDIDNSAGPGIRIDSNDDGIAIQNQNGNGIDIDSVSGHGISSVGDSNGIFTASGNVGHGIEARGGITSGDGIHSIAVTLGDGIEAVGAGGGFDINADIQGSLSGSVASVTGNVGGNVVGSVGSIATGGITAASFAAGAIDAAAIATDAIGSAELAASAVNEIADQVWDELLAGHAVSGSTGEALTNAAAGGSPAAIADAVWDELRAGHVVSGSFGEGVASVQGNVTGSVASVTGNVGGNVVGTVASVVGNVGGNVVGNVNGTVASVVGNVGGNVTGSVGSVAAGGIAAASFAAGAIDAAAIAADAIGSSELAASAVNEIADQVWDELLAGHAISGSTGEALTNAGSGASAGVIADAVWDELRAGHVVAGSFGEGVASVQGNVTGSVASVTGNVAGNVVGSVGSVAAGGITAASIATDAIDSDAIAASAVTEIQAGLATSAALATVQADTDDIQTRLPAALVGGRMDSSVGAMAADVITAAAIATDAIGSAELAASAVTEIQAGLATSAALAVVQADTDDIQTRLPAALVGGRMDSSVGAMAAGVVTAAAVATGAIDADALATDAVDEIVDQTWNELIAGHLGVGSTGEALNNAAAGGAGLTAQQVRDAMKLAPSAGAPAVDSIDDDLDDIQLRIPATLVGGRMRSHVEAMDAGTITAAVIATDAVDADAIAANAVTEIQAGLATAAALAVVQADTDDIQTRLPATLSGGRMRSQVEGMDADTVTASAIATDAIGSAELAASAVTEIQSGLATSAALATVQSDTDDIQARLPATLNGGRMRSHVEAMDAGTITAAVIATGAVDADALAADAGTEIAAAVDVTLTAAHGAGAWGGAGAPTVAQIADGVWDEILAGHLTAGSTGAALDAAASGGAGLTQQQVADALKLVPAAGAPDPGSVYDRLVDIETCACAGGAGGDVEVVGI